ncbi:MAG TPA: trimeric intracellular cation channel family protein [Longimicrobiaceae bacterium]
MIYTLQILGVAVFAASGAIAAGRRRMDLIGVVVLAVVTAVGGGTIRDLLLDRQPFWIADPAYLVASVAAVVATLLYTRRRRPPENTLAIVDALGLGFFTIGGVQIAEQAGVGGVVAVLMGTITGVAGGVIRDVLSAEVPLIFRGGKLYATTCVVGSTVYLLLEWAGLARDPAALAGMVTVMALRFAAILWGLEIPVFNLKEE